MSAYFVFQNLQFSLICNWLDAKDLGILDGTFLSHSAREPWLNVLKSVSSETFDEWRHNHSSMRWVITKGIRVTQVLFNPDYSSGISDRTFEAVDMNNHRIESAYDVIRIPTLKIWGGCKYIQRIDLQNCHDITDMALTALGNGCRQR
jgi:hypothetical protein